MGRSVNLIAAVAAALLAMIALPANAANKLRLDALFTDHAVLQAGKPIPIAGHATPGTKVSVTLLRWGASAVAGPDGRWIATLPAILPSQAPLRLVASAGGEEVAAEDILVGEVWIAAGQSNMEWPLETSEEGYKTSTRDAFPLLRFFKVERRQTIAPADDVRGRWIVVAPRQVGDIGAVPYFFGRALMQRIGRATGVIQIAYGGTKIEAWTPPALIAAPNYPEEARINLATQHRSELAARLAAAQAIEKWASTNPSSGDLEHTDAPMWPEQAADGNIPGGTYNAMMQPAAPYAVSGIIWYQGESNHREGYTYRKKLEVFLDAMDALWGKLPFAMVQTAPFMLADANTPDLWQAQQDVARARGLGFITISDTVDVENIHPRKKQAVGERLAAWALADVYHLTGDVYTGPLARAAVRRGEAIEVSFDHADGLNALGGDISGFEWIDASGVVRSATAVIAGMTVRLTAPGISSARQVRYAWSPTARPALRNGAGLPAATFRLPVGTKR